MRSKTKKSISRLAGIWTFVLLLIFKGIFPKPAYAFLSSLDACAANPECAAIVGSELSPAVAAPTAEGIGTTISTTTATEASTTVEAAAEVTIVGDRRLSGIVAYYIWNQANNEQGQNKAKERYCVANPLDLVCGGQANVTYNIEATLHSTDSTYSYDYFYSGTAVGPINYAKTDADSWLTGWSSPIIGIYNNDGTRTGSLGWDIRGTGGYPLNEFAQVTGITITSITRQDGQPETPPLPWKDWPQEKRDAAVKLLNDSDWQGLITSMPNGGTLNPGDTINAPTIVIPGTDGTKTQSGPYTIPDGYPNALPSPSPDPSPSPSPEESPSPSPSPSPDPSPSPSPDPSPSPSPDPSPSPSAPTASGGSPSPSPDPSPSPSPDPSPSPSAPTASGGSPSPSPEASSDTSQNPPPTVPGPGVGGNGTASEFGDLTGISHTDADAFLRSLGATVKTTAGSYTQYKFPDNSTVSIRLYDGRVTRTPAPIYGSDGRRINRGLRLGKDGSLLQTMDSSGNKISDTHDTGEFVH